MHTVDSQLPGAKSLKEISLVVNAGFKSNGKLTSTDSRIKLSLKQFTVWSGDSGVREECAHVLELSPLSLSPNYSAEWSAASVDYVQL